MSHQDKDRLTVSSPQHQALKQSLDWLLDSAQLAKLTFRRDCTWTSKAFIFAAICWSWSDEKTLTDRFIHARKVIIAVLGLVEMPATSYQAFLKMLKTWSLPIASALMAAFRYRM